MADSAAHARRAARRSRLYRWDLTAVPYAYVAPFFLLFAAFGLYPLIYTGWLSFHTVQLSSLDTLSWAGLRNYADLLASAQFWKAFRNTFTMGVVSAVPQLLMALGLAHLLNYRLRGSTLWRVASLLPYATSIGAAALFFQQVFSRQFGLVNWVFELVGLPRIDWEGSTVFSQLAVSSIVIWRWTGYNALLYLAAMQAVPQDLYEAAELDGASRWRQFLTVTIPGIRPTIVFTAVISTIGSIQLFGEPMIFGGGATGVQGGASNQYQTLGLLLYQTGWANGNAGRASALAWLMFLIIVVLALARAVVARARQGKQKGSKK